MLPRFYYLPFLAWCLIVGATSVGLCFIPLFNLLAFEFAFAISIPLTLVGGHIGVLMKRDTRNWYGCYHDHGDDVRPHLLRAVANPVKHNAFKIVICWRVYFIRHLSVNRSSHWHCFGGRQPKPSFRIGALWRSPGGGLDALSTAH